MAVSSGFRRGMKNRTRRSRHIEVGFFFVLMAMGLSFAGLPFRWGQFGMRAFPLVFAAGRIYRLWDLQRRVMVRSLDDRAMLGFGVVLLPAVALYWLGWTWLPPGNLRESWTDAPIVMVWMALLIVALPQLIQMWTEQDEVGEPGLTAKAGER